MVNMLAWYSRTVCGSKSSAIPLHLADHRYPARHSAVLCRCCLDIPQRTDEYTRNSDPHCAISPSRFTLEWIFDLGPVDPGRRYMMASMRTLTLAGPAALLVTILTLTGCSQPKPSAEDVKKFLDTAEQKLNDLGVESSRGSWVQENFITDDTEALSAA